MNCRIVRSLSRLIRSQMAFLVTPRSSAASATVIRLSTVGWSESALFFFIKIRKKLLDKRTVISYTRCGWKAGGLALSAASRSPRGLEHAGTKDAIKADGVSKQRTRALNRGRWCCAHPRPRNRLESIASGWSLHERASRIALFVDSSL